MVRDEGRISNRLLAFWRNRIKPFWREYEVPAFIIMGVLAIVLGYIGYDRFFNAHVQTRPPLDLIFMTLQLFRMMFFQAAPLPWELEIARWLAAFVILYAAFRVVTTIFYEQAHLLILRWLTRGHVVICGVGDNGARMAGEFYKMGYGVAIIEKNMSKEVARKCKEQGAIILNGSATEKEFLRRARIDRAKYLISAMADDGANAEVAVLARELVSGKRGLPLTCYIHIVDRRLCNLLKVDYEFSSKKNEAFRLEFFNTYDDGARALLTEYPPFAGNNINGNIGVVGTGGLAESLMLQAATAWLFRRASANDRLSITLIDENAAKNKTKLLVRYPLVEKTCDISAYEMDAVTLSSNVNIPGLPGMSRIYVCMEKDTDCLSTALMLRKTLAGQETSVVACMSQSSGLSKLAGNMGRKTEGLHFFTILDSAYKPEVLLGGTREIIARAIHEEYLQNQEKLGFTPDTNPSIRPWDMLPEELKESNRHNADHILIKLAGADCDIELLTDASALNFSFEVQEVEKMAIQEHERWMEERLRQGWTYAEEKNIEKKTSPYLVPWERLSEEIREYDRNVIRGLPIFLARAGFQIYRIKPSRAILELPIVIKSV